MKTVVWLWLFVFLVATLLTLVHREFKHQDEEVARESAYCSAAGGVMVRGLRFNEKVCVKPILQGGK